MTFQLQILHASDFEGGIPALNDAVGFSTVVNALKDDYANTLILSSGDNYIPGPFFSASSDPSVASAIGAAGVGRGDIAILNGIGVQASVFGNHEFDLGTSTIQSLIVPSGNYQGAEFPYLSANLDFSGDASLASRVVAPGQDFTNVGSTQSVVLANGTTATDNRGRISSSAVITVNGERIGIVGTTTPTLPSISSPGPGVTVTPDSFNTDPTADQLDALAAIIQPQVDALTATGINKVILLSHMQQFPIEQALATRLNDVDVVIAGGSHQLFADNTDTRRPEDLGSTVPNYPSVITNTTTGEQVLVINTAANYRYVGRLVADFDLDGKIIPNSIDPNISGAYATDAANVAALIATNTAAGGVTATPNAEVVAATNALQNVIVSKDGNIFGSTSVFLNGTRDDVRIQETNLGNLTADANLTIARDYDPTVTISIKNGGGIRDNIGFIPSVSGSQQVEKLPPSSNPLANKDAGDISQLDIENSLRFNNDLSLVTITAAQLEQIMEHAVAGTGTGRTPGQFPQVGGIAFSFDATRTARTATTEGDRIRSLAIKDENGKTIDIVVNDGQLVGDPNRTFRMVTLGFLASGGDGYPFQGFTSTLNRRDLLIAGAARTGQATFAADGTEQDAFAEYLTRIDTYNQADTAPAQDTRIQNLAARTDTVLSDVVTGSGSLFGTNTDDIFLARGDNNTIYANEGNNKITATGLNNKVFAGNGNDNITVGNGNNEIYANEGNNTIFAGNGNDIIYTGSGNDFINAGTGIDTIWLNGGKDTVVLNRDGADIINGFQLGQTSLALSGDLKFTDLTITQGDGAALISVGDELLASLSWVQATSLNSNSFVMV
ncbi:MAG: 5'-nucleotidase C-terminal domain-containing protein [Calothrix sp. FI2-JRJ7]|jgi:2',3'-cyclic-nucleotide 2'-phosphodiesterase (5'-nucleotidase family)|nr:5'-nucleotidase C-terminal domain-containing protein [Calothrix sp. FI2-JRJ7]